MSQASGSSFISRLCRRPFGPGSRTAGACLSRLLTTTLVLGHLNTAAEPDRTPQARGQTVDGAWQRWGRAVAGEAVHEPTRAFWLQAGPVFADLRVLRTAPLNSTETMTLDYTQAFTGTFRLVAGCATWAHEIDTEPRAPGHSDTAKVNWDQMKLAQLSPPPRPVVTEAGLATDVPRATKAPSEAIDVLVEDGGSYIEYWARATPPGTPAVVFERREAEGKGALTARLVVVGNIAIVVWSSPVPGGSLHVNTGASEAPPKWQLAELVSRGGSDLVPEGKPLLEEATTLLQNLGLFQCSSLGREDTVPPGWQLLVW